MASNTADASDVDWYVFRGEIDNDEGQGTYASHIQIHFSVKRIGYEAFIYCQSLLEIRLPEGLQVIEQGAFAHCESLTTVHVPNTVKVIQDMAFVECTSLTSITLSDALQVISQSLFEGCTALKHVKLPRYLKTIKDSSFCRCQSLQTLHLPTGLKRIGDWALSDCYALVSIAVPSTVEQLGRYCFQNCIELLSIELPNGLHYIGDHCFADCSSLINMVIPTTFEHAGSYPLLDRTRLQKQFRGQGHEVESYEDETLVQALCHRFDDLPIHNFCYHLSHASGPSSTADDSNKNHQMDHLEELVLLHGSSLSSLPSFRQVDAFGMTPFHILALSATPTNLAASYRFLLDKASGDDAYDTMYLKDIFGCTAMDYLCRNSAILATTKSLMEYSMDSAVIIPKLRHLGLDSWRMPILTAIEKMLEQWEDLHSSRDHRMLQLRKVLYTLAKQERLESMSLLESLLWKMQIEKQKEQSAVQCIITEEEREYCRISCGADMVIPNVLPFLVSVDEKEYLRIQQSKID